MDGRSGNTTSAVPFANVHVHIMKLFFETRLIVSHTLVNSLSVVCGDYVKT